MEKKSINLTKELHLHMSVIYLNASSDLDFLIADSPNYYRKAEILETECFMLSHILLELRVKSLGYLEKSDFNLFGKIFGNLYDNYLGDCFEIEEELMIRTAEQLTAMEKRMDDYKKLYLKEGPLEIAKMFFNIFFHEIEAMQIYTKNSAFSTNLKMNVQSFGALTKLFENTFAVADLFFKGGITAYIEKELRPTDEFKKIADEYLWHKYI
jgi:hypothetical protein